MSQHKSAFQMKMTALGIAQDIVNVWVRHILKECSKNAKKGLLSGTVSIEDNALDEITPEIERVLTELGYKVDLTVYMYEVGIRTYIFDVSWGD